MCKCSCKEQIRPLMKFRKLNKNAAIPAYAKKGDAGADLKSVVNLTINPGCNAIVDTGLQLEMTEGWEAQVRSRSGLAAKKQVFVLNGIGTVDNSYRGSIGVILQNLGKEPFIVAIGDRIAQIVFKQSPEVIIAEEINPLSETDRADGGFGSTGIR